MMHIQEGELPVEALASSGRPLPGTPAGAVRPRPIGRAVPTTSEQRTVLLHTSLTPELPLYNEPFTIERKGFLDRRALEKSLDEIVRRHEILRTSFVDFDGEVTPIVHDKVAVPLTFVDLQELPQSERESAALGIAVEDAHKQFDMASAPLLRATLVTIGPENHSLFINTHQAIMDRISIYEVFVPELLELYDSYSSGTEPRLKLPPLQYGDFAVGREERAASQDLARQLDYWRKTLSGKLPVLQVPTGRARSPLPSFRASMESISLPMEVLGALKNIGKDTGATLYMTLLAAVSSLLHRYTGANDMLLGGVADTRRRPELRRVLGYFLNSIVFRMRPTASMTFRECILSAQDTVLSALGASDIPFDELVREVQPRRDPMQHPFFQIMFGLVPPTKEFPPGWDISRTEVEVSKYDLYFEFNELPDALVVRLHYNTDLFEAPTINRMLGHLSTLLSAAGLNPDCRLGALPLLTERESRQLLIDWNDTGADCPGVTLHEWFESQVHRCPEAVAVEWEGRTWTYLELNQRAESLADLLYDAGVRCETLVALCVERSLDMVAGVLAILKAGGAYLPLDPAFPDARLAYMLEDAQPRVLLTERALLAKFATSNIPKVLCDKVHGRVYYPIRGRRSSVGPDSLAYVLYTSGSTGKPKGVQILHRGVVNELRAFQQAPGFEPGDVMLALATICFDIATLELLLPLVSGGRVVVVGREVATDPARLIGVLERSGCTVMQATPPTWRALIDAGWIGKANLKILCGAEPLSRRLADNLLARGASLWNLYGPTETTIWCTVHQVHPGTGPVLIGRPIQNMKTYVLDAVGNPVPIGVSGELYVGGVGIGRGYLNRVELNKERFVRPPVAEGELLYRTGDMARYIEDGSLECLGRTDNQVKVRGFRVELEEVEAAIGTHPAVGAAAVRCWPDAAGEACLAAYVVLRGAAMPDAQEWRGYLRKMLPDYMIPARFVTIPELPLTPTKKVDRKALPEPEAARALDRYTAPRTRTEKKLADTWRKLLGVHDLGLDDDFFALGGHSLLIAKLVRQIELAFGQRISMATVFQAPTIREMAAILRDTRPHLELPQVMKIQPKGSLPPLFWLDAGPFFRPLSEALGSDQPFLGLSLDPDEETALGHDFEISEVATLLHRKLKSAQPKGPYFIAGFCSWGIVAFELASQLIAEGEDVGLVVMVDAAHPSLLRRYSVLRIELSKVRWHFTEAFQMARAQGLNYLMTRARGALGRYRHTVANTAARTAVPQFRASLHRAWERYEPEAYRGSVALFQPLGRPAILNCFPDWQPLITGQFGCVDIPGDHLTMFEQPNVSLLAAEMNQWLSNVRTPLRSKWRAAG